MAEITALLAHKFVMNTAKSHIVLEMVGADGALLTLAVP
jgi:hypothetical protein